MIFDVITDFVVPMFIGIGILAVVFIWAFYPVLESNEINDMCIKEGYDKGHFSIFGGSYCKEEINGTIYKIEIERCGENGKRICNVVGNDALVSGEKTE